MLGTTLWFTIAIGLLAAVLLDAAAAFGRAGIHAAADHAIESAMHDAVADYQNQLQDAIAHTVAQPATQPFAGAPPPAQGYATALAAIPNPLTRTLLASSGDTGPRFTLSYAITPTTTAAPSCTSNPSQGTDTIGWLQCSGFVQESRVSLKVDVTVLDAAGTQQIARRSQYVTLRLFAEPPYTTIVGRKDAAAVGPAGIDAETAPAHEGDVGGDTVSGASPPPPSPWPAGGTVIHVRYECHDGAGRCVNAAPPDPDNDLRYGARWSNGNRPLP